MVETIPNEVATLIEDLRKQVASLTGRLAKLESPAVTPVGSSVLPAALPVSKPEPEPGLTEEELLAISGALAAYLGVRVHIRQVRLIGSRAWAQQGRVSIQASHTLHG